MSSVLGAANANLRVQIMGNSDPNNGGGSLQFGAGTGIGTDNAGAAMFTSGANGRDSDYVYLTGGPLDIVPDSTNPSVSYEVTFATNVAQTANWMGIMGSWNLPSNTEHVALTLSAVDGTLQAYWVQTRPNGLYRVNSLSSTNDYWNGRTHHAVFVITDDFTSNTTTGTLYVDGVQVDSGTFTGGTHGGATGVSFFEVGRSAPGGNYRGFDGTLSHVAIYKSALALPSVQDHYKAQSGWAGQKADERLSTLANIWGYPLTDFEPGISVLAGQATNGNDILSAMEKVAADSDDGVLFISRDGYLTFQNRWHRINRSVGFSVTSGQIAPDVQISYDHQLVKNVISVSSQNQSEAPATAQDDNSVSLFDVRSESIDTVLPQSALMNRAYAMLEKTRMPRLRVPGGIRVIPDNDLTLCNTLLGTDIGDSFSVTSMPSNGPASTLEFDIDGIQHQFMYPEWNCRLITSPRPTHNWGTVDTTSYATISDTTYVGW